MSLNFTLSGIENYERVCYDDAGQLRPITHALIFATLSVGLGEITEKNAAEFYARLNLYERMAGSYLTGPDGDILITPQEVTQHIGLTTNVSNETTAQWARRIITDKNTGILKDLRKAYMQSLVDRDAIERSLAGEHMVIAGDPQNPHNEVPHFEKR